MKMLKRGYIILIVGGVLFVAGIVITAAGAGSLAGQFLQENTTCYKEYYPCPYDPNEKNILI